MKHRWLAVLSALAVLPYTAPANAVDPNDPGVTFIGFGLVPGNALDKSGLAGKKICSLADATNCIDQATLGGFGSGISYTGFANIFAAVPDRGPFDGRTNVPYLDRFHYITLSVKSGSAFSFPDSPNVGMQLLDTNLMHTATGQKFVGDSYNSQWRFDPEGLRVGLLGTIIVSDEYGPYINEFTPQGVLVRKIRVPDKFLIANPTGDVDSAGNSLELYPDHNTSGRQANRGMEGLAITPNGRYVFGMMQNALIQDNGLDSNTPPGRKGFNNRILKVDLLTGKTWEYVYVMDTINQGKGVNDLLAINDHEFLAIERDNRSLNPTPPNAAQSPNVKSIFKIDVTGATDVSKVASLPTTGAELAGLGIKAVTKSLFIDLLKTGYVVSSSPLKTIKDVIAEKIEGLAWGPDLPGKKHLLYVTSDNDLYPGLPTQIFAFAIDDTQIDFKRQLIVLPPNFGH